MHSEYPNISYLARYPNGEVRFVNRSKVPSKATDSRDPIHASPLDPWHLAWVQAVSRLDEPSACVSRTCEGATAPKHEDALGRTPKFQQNPEPLPNGWGSVPDKWPSFSASAKRAINLRAAAASRHFPKSQQVFLTGTLPGSTDEACQVLSAYSGYLMNRLQKWLRDHYSIDGQLYHLGVWEHQKRGALHYHAFVVVPQGTEESSVKERFASFWFRLLDQLSDSTGIDLYERSNGQSWRNLKEKIVSIAAYAQTVKKSVASYLSKYLSKDQGKQDDASFYPPSRWWASTRAITRLVSLYTDAVPLPSTTSEDGRSLIEYVTALCEGFKPDFLVNLVNGFSRQVYGTCAIFDDYQKSLDVFDFLASLLKDCLSPLASEQSLLSRMKWVRDMEAVKKKQEIDYLLECEDYLFNPWKLRPCIPINEPYNDACQSDNYLLQLNREQGEMAQLSLPITIEKDHEHPGFRQIEFRS